jgi:hypothetical protein
MIMNDTLRQNIRCGGTSCIHGDRRQNGGGYLIVLYCTPLVSCTVVDDSINESCMLNAMINWTGLR